MSDTRCEQHPLLYEDLSEEEQLSPSYQKRSRPMVIRGRAKNKVRGAVAVIKRWPDHWSTSLTYWWIALGMIAIVTLIIYNSIAALALPSDHFRGIKTRSSNNVTNTNSNLSPELNSVYMHLFFDKNKDVEFNGYMPYIEIIAEKFPDYKYKLIVITNDTNVDNNVLSAEENNEIAFNLLWTNNNVHHLAESNIVVEQVTLTKYMENSPLGMYWRTLPNQFTEFLARAVSIWEKGGISFNPIILTPRSPNAIYIETLHDILRNYPNIPKKVPIDQGKIHHGDKTKVNNIRDIIDALERETGDLSPTQQSLEEAESRIDIVVANSQPRDIDNVQGYTFNNTNLEYSHESEILQQVSSNETSSYSPVIKIITKKEKLPQDPKSESANPIINTSRTNDTQEVSLLPKFLDFLFLNKPFGLDKSSYSLNEEPKVKTRKRKHVLPTVSKRHKNLSTTNVMPKKQEPVINSANNSIKQYSVNETEIFSQLAIDLKGNIIASVTPCHAFLGTIFSNLAHNSEESLTDFIITELTIFCKGILTSCYGIDVILT